MNPKLFRLLIIGFGVFYTINHFFITDRYLNGCLWIVATVGSGAVVIYNNYRLNKQEQAQSAENLLFDKCFILPNNLSPEEKNDIDQQVKDLEATGQKILIIEGSQEVYIWEGKQTVLVKSPANDKSQDD